MQLNWSNLEPHSPFIASLLEEERFYGIAQQLLGEDVVGMNSHSNHYAGDRSPWHPDVPANVHGFKFTFYLAPVQAETGALRVIPGSHRPEFSDLVKRVQLRDNDPEPPDDSALAVDEVPCHACESQPGDAVLFNYLLWHASWGGSKDRRMVSLQYYKNPKTPAEKAATEEWVRQFRKSRNDKQTIDSRWPEFWVDNPESNPLRARWIAWMREWGLM